MSRSMLLEFKKLSMIMSRMSCTRRCLSCWKLSPLHTHISWLRAWCPGMLSHSHDWWGLDALELLLTMLGAWCPEEPNYAHISWLGAWCSVLVPNAFAYQEVLRWFKMWSCRVVKLLSCQDAKMIWDVKSCIVELSRIVELSEVWLWSVIVIRWLWFNDDVCLWSWLWTWLWSCFR
jgi:hypothetical protein